MIDGGLLTPDSARIPIKNRYYLSELAPFLSREYPGDEERQRQADEATLRTLERLCERGVIRALRVGRNIVVFREDLERAFVAMNTLASDN